MRLGADHCLEAVRTALAAALSRIFSPEDSKIDSSERDPSGSTMNCTDVRPVMRITRAFLG